MEEKAMVSTAELGPMISELKSIMQKKATVQQALWTWKRFGCR